MAARPDLAELFQDVLTVREAAALLRVSETTIYTAAASGDLPSYRVGRPRRLRPHLPRVLPSQRW